ncbi:MAG: UDP-N-acetylmuramate--L-alanine ligase [Candidatus Omnitrophica bacterium]|nr:UDP-N-acetylmuramate--L-alanine ligase [Candidatus Omnitrophota bacterium]
MRIELIRLLERGKKVFLIGIGGIGMSALARILESRGLEVSGSDSKRSRTLERLETDGIQSTVGHDGSFRDQPDWVVTSSAISKTNPDLKRAEELGIPVYHRAEVLSFLTNQVISLAITGAHGKTTCSAMASFLMTQAGLNPSCAVGGEILNFGSNVVIGDPHLYVIEVDESDRSQLNFYPDFALITNLDSEHLDVYKNLADIKSSFKLFIDQVKTTGRLIYCMDNLHLKEIALEAPPGTVNYGLNPTADFSAKDIVLDGFHSSYVLFEKGEKIDEVRLSIPGIHNVLNSLGVIALLRSFGLRYEPFLKHTVDFRGAGRRFEVKLNRKELLVIDDYAHHPTEVNATLTAIRDLGKKTTVVFQPHRFSRTFHLADEFSQVFQSADRVLLTDIYGAGEDNPNQVDVSLIYEAVKKNGHPNVRMIKRDEIIDFLVAHREMEETVAFLGAGDIGEIADEFASRFENAYSH